MGRNRQQNVRILLLEDSDLDAELITVAINKGAATHTVYRVDSEADYVRALGEFIPDVVISDHALAQFNSRAARELARVLLPTAAFIIVTGSLDTASVVAALRNGVEDVVLKNDLGAVAPAIEAAFDRRVALRMLSPRQLQVFQLIVAGHTTPDIAERLGLGEKTVETHRREVMKRLGIRDVAGLVRYAFRVGLVAVD